jgi:hypothetical protein
LVTVQLPAGLQLTFAAQFNSGIVGSSIQSTSRGISSEGVKQSRGAALAAKLSDRNGDDD